MFHLISRFAAGRYHLDRAGARERYLDLLGRTLERTDCRVLAYCLMSSHVHLVVVQGQEPLERLCKPLHTGLAGWVNARSKRASGPVFAGRPRSILVEEDAYLLQLVRYVHNNPVRARVSRFARTCDWSSHGAYVGRVEPPQWLALGYVLEHFGGSSRSRASRFDTFVNDGRRESRRDDLSGSATSDAIAKAKAVIGDGFYVSDAVLGSEAFAQKVRADVERVQQTLATAWIDRGQGRQRRPTLDAVVERVCVALELEPWEFEAHPKRRQPALARRLIVWLWVHHYDGKQVEVARRLKAGTASVADWYGRAVKEAAEMDELASAITQELDRPRARRRSGGQAVRFHVDVSDP